VRAQARRSGRRVGRRVCAAVARARRGGCSEQERRGSERQAAGRHLPPPGIARACAVGRCAVRGWRGRVCVEGSRQKWEGKEATGGWGRQKEGSEWHM